MCMYCLRTLLRSLGFSGTTKSSMVVLSSTHSLTTVSNCCADSLSPNTLPAVLKHSGKQEIKFASAPLPPMRPHTTSRQTSSTAQRQATAVPKKLLCQSAPCFWHQALAAGLNGSCARPLRVDPNMALSIDIANGNVSIRDDPGISTVCTIACTQTSVVMASQSTKERTGKTRKKQNGGPKVTLQLIQTSRLDSLADLSASCGRA
mmetsp:Transcript_98482/g.278487  ORF Transcript_98482/g.278487 Transcript_98482/m.278487 type:complete len:205 (+) Transcript_98482:124-738(+)